ncbi:MAG: hypothetical protein LBV19_09855 [Streptococcaceae bacterium]|jgi:hypothetical protein|nr:hypothetical protein [Streptococcaceae bacterium]
MKYLLKYGTLGAVFMMALVVIISKLQLGQTLTDNLILVLGVILFTALGAILKIKVKKGKQ